METGVLRLFLPHGLSYVCVNLFALPSASVSVNQFLDFDKDYNSTSDPRSRPHRESLMCWIYNLTEYRATVLRGKYIFCCTHRWGSLSTSQYQYVVFLLRKVFFYGSVYRVTECGD